jgi:hypothetical protein
MGSPHIKGPFTDKEIEYIKNNYQLLTDREMASALGRPIKSITNKRTNLGLSNKGKGKAENKEKFRATYISSLSQDDKRVEFTKELRGSSTYRAAKKCLNKHEVAFYEEKFLDFMLDPSIETMTAPEKDALHEMIMCQVQLNRLREEQLRQQSTMQPFNKHRDMKDLQDTILKYQQNLKVTREKRLRDNSDSAMTFTNLIKEMRNPATREKLGYEAAMLKYIAEKTYNNYVASNNIMSGQEQLFDVDDLFKDGMEPDGLNGNFTPSE